MRIVLRKVPALLAFGVLAGIVPSVMAQDPQASPAAPNANTAGTPDQAQQTPAGKFIQDLGDKAIAVIADKSLAQDQRASHYEALLHDAFDIPAIGRFVLGRAWNTATPQQQQDYLKLFETLVIKTYSEKLSFYSGEGFHVKGVRPESDKDMIVSSEITHPQGTPPTAIEWRVHQTDGKFTIVDVVVEGISQSVTQRQEYASVLERNSGNIDALLKLMRDRAQKPATTSILEMELDMEQPVAA